MRTDLVIQNGRVVTPAGVKELDVGIAGGKIVFLEKESPHPAPTSIDAKGRLVLPGCIDAHTHMGIPILHTHSADDFASGSIAAACGGVTTLLDFTVQQPGQSLLESLEARLRQAERWCHIDYGLHINITDQPEKWLSQIPQLIKLGYTSFKIFSTYENMMVNEDAFKKILEKVSEHGGLVMLHAEDHGWIERLTRRHVATGKVTPIFHARSRPPRAEAEAIARAGRWARVIGAPLYIVHLSSAAGLEAARKARDAGTRLFLETCPQYLLLTEQRYLDPNGHYYITTPPLRKQKDCRALWEALATDEIDVIATDHCPFTRAQKESGGGNFLHTPNGLPGVETLFPLLYTHGVAESKITLTQLVRLVAAHPAEIFHLQPAKGSITIGADADLVIWDPSSPAWITSDNLHGNDDWSPYEGTPTAGRVVTTFVRGQMVVHQGRFVGDDIFGQNLCSPN